MGTDKALAYEEGQEVGDIIVEPPVVNQQDGGTRVVLNFGSGARLVVAGDC